MSSPNQPKNEILLQTASDVCAGVYGCEEVIVRVDRGDGGPLEVSTL